MTRLKELELGIYGGPGGKASEFANQTRCVSALVERLLPSVVTDGVWKALFYCVTEAEQGRPLISGGVCQIEVSADVEKFFVFDDRHKKRWTFETLQRGVDRLLPQIGWPREPFNYSFAEAEKLGLKNERIWRKRSSPSRRLAAEVLVQHEVQFCHISIIIRDHRGAKLRDELLISDTPDEFIFVSHLGSLQWISESQVVLISQDGSQQWAVDL